MNSKWIKVYFGMRSFFSPKGTGKLGFKVFQKVRMKRIREREERFYSEAKLFKVPTDHEDIDCYELGKTDGKLVFLVHGWESNAGSLSQLAFRFADMGYRVIAFNLPGHAFYTSSSTNLLQCKLAMQSVLKFVNPTQSFSVVSHSFGSAVVANALSGTDYPVDRLVFLTNPNKIEHIFREFKTIVGMGEKAYQEMVNVTTNMLGAPISSLDVDTNLGKINFSELLLIHDVKDRVLPFSNSEAILSVTENTELFELNGVGHYKMLWSEEVVDKTTSFIEEAR